MPLHVSSKCTHHQEVKIVLHSLWYHHTYRCDYTRGCVMQFWPPDDEHICSKHVEAWNKLIVKQKPHLYVWLYQRLCNAILTWWWAHVLETCRGMKLTYCKTKILCIKLVNYWDKYTEMHGQQNVKKCSPCSTK